MAHKLDRGKRKKQTKLDLQKAFPGKSVLTKLNQAFIYEGLVWYCRFRRVSVGGGAALLNLTVVWWKLINPLYQLVYLPKFSTKYEKTIVTKKSKNFKPFLNVWDTKQLSKVVGLHFLELKVMFDKFNFVKRLTKFLSFLTW